MSRYIDADKLISRQAAIEVVRTYDFNFPQYMERFVIELRDAMKKDLEEDIKQMPSAQQWIPCSERLPKNEDTYLVAFDKSNLLDDETQVSDAYWMNNQWQYSVLESYEHRMPNLVIEPIEELKVIAWMPLPEPYADT